MSLLKELEECEELKENCKACAMRVLKRDQKISKISEEEQEKYEKDIGKDLRQVSTDDPKARSEAVELLKEIFSVTGMKTLEDFFEKLVEHDFHEHEEGCRVERFFEKLGKGVHPEKSTKEYSEIQILVSSIRDFYKKFAYYKVIRDKGDF